MYIFLRVRSGFVPKSCPIFKVVRNISIFLLGTPKSPNIYARISCPRIFFARIIVSTKPNCFLITIRNKYGHLRSYYVSFPPISTIPPPFSHSRYMPQNSIIFHLFSYILRNLKFFQVLPICSKMLSFVKFCALISTKYKNFLGFTYTCKNVSFC